VVPADVRFDGRGIAAPVAQARNGNSRHEFKWKSCVWSGLFAGMPVKPGFGSRQVAGNHDLAVALSA